MMKNEMIKAKGMSCEHCEKRVNNAILELDGVASCVANAKKGEIKVSFDETKTSLKAICEVIDEAGYEVI